MAESRQRRGINSSLPRQKKGCQETGKKGAAKKTEDKPAQCPIRWQERKVTMKGVVISVKFQKAQKG